jgi:hypothetical protein
MIEDFIKMYPMYSYCSIVTGIKNDWSLSNLLIIIAFGNIVYVHNEAVKGV